MTKVKKPKIDEERLGINPFLSNLKIPVNTITLHGQWTKDKEGLMLPVEVDLESESFCRVYVGGGRRLQMVGLSPRTKDLLLWIIYEADNSKDWLWLNKVRYMAECGVKAYNTYRDAVSELQRNNFIQPAPIHGVYWINPHLFFNGSRINRFPGNVVKK